MLILFVLFVLVSAKQQPPLQDCDGMVINDAILACSSADNVTLNAAFSGIDAPGLTSIRGTLLLFGVTANTLTFSNLSEVRYISVAGGNTTSLLFPNVSRCDAVQLAVRTNEVPIMSLHMPFVASMLSLTVRDNTRVVMPQLAMLDTLTVNGANISVDLPVLTFVQSDVRLALIDNAPLVLPRARSVGASLRIAAGNVSMAALDTVGRDLIVNFGDNLNWEPLLSAPNLTSVGGTFVTVAPEVDHPVLVDVGGNLCMLNAASTLINLPLLKSVGGDRLDGVLCSANSSAALDVSLANGTSLNMPSLRSVRGDVFILVGDNASVIQPSLHAESMSVYCRLNSAATIRLSGSTFRNGLRIECNVGIDALEMMPPMSVGGNVSLFLADTLENLANVSMQLTPNNDTVPIDRCLLVAPGVCVDEAVRMMNYWNCRMQYVAPHIHCQTCGNSVLNFGELADCGPRHGCLVFDDCMRGKFDAKTCKCLNSTSVIDGSSGGNGLPITEISLSVSGVALCLIAVIAAYFIRRALRRSRQLTVSFDDLQPKFERI
jgi:hypothetical protein